MTSAGRDLVTAAGGLMLDRGAVAKRVGDAVHGKHRIRTQLLDLIA